MLQRGCEQTHCARKLQMLLYDILCKNLYRDTLLSSTESPPQQTTNAPFSASGASDGGSFCSPSSSETAATARVRPSVVACEPSLDLDLLGPGNRGLKRAEPLLIGGLSNFLSASSNLVLLLPPGATPARDVTPSAPPMAALTEPALFHAPPGVTRVGAPGLASFPRGGNSFDSESPPPDVELDADESCPGLLTGDGVPDKATGGKRDLELLLLLALLDDVPFERL